MKKYILLGILVFSFVATPAMAQAQSLAELMELIAKLEQQLSDLKNRVAEQIKLKPQPPVVCYNWSRNLKKGDRGDDVLKLKEVLAAEGLAVSTDTEVFDDETEARVIKLQEKYSSEVLGPYGLVRGTGYVGTSTRSKLQKIYCGNSGQITVLSPNGGETWTKGSTETITWNTLRRVDFPTLESTTGSGANAQVAANIDIYLEYPPCVGDVCAVVGISPTHVVAKSIPDTGSFVWRVGETVSNTFPGDGTYAIKVCSGRVCDTSDSYFKITSGDPNNKPPVIREVEGPTKLRVDQRGRWEVKASDPERGNLRYSVVWGDEKVLYDATTGAAVPPPLESVVQTAIFTHTYATTGVYYPTFTVTDSAGNSESTSLTVRVGEAANLGTAKISVISNDGRTLTNASVSLCQTSGSVGTCTIARKTDGGSVVFDAAPGTYTAKAYAAGYKPNDGTITLYANRTSWLTIKLTPETSTPNRPPVITGVSGPTSLGVGATGTWTISAYDPEGGAVTYAAAWGDVVGMPEAIMFGNGASFQHSYGTVGTKTVTFYVNDDAGNQMTSSITVNVGNTLSGTLRVLSPNGGETWFIGPSYSVTWVADGERFEDLSLSLVRSDGAVCSLGTTDVDLGAYTTSVGGNTCVLSNLNVPFTPGQYKLLIVGGEGSDRLSDHSDGYFNVSLLTS